jgi:ribosomal protein S27E
MGSPRAKNYKCADCNLVQKIHWTERARASRVRCSGCGSYALDPHSEAAVREVLDEGRNAEVGGPRAVDNRGVAPKRRKDQ